MAENKNKTIKVVSADGKEIVCEVLATFTSKETGKSYMIYTDNSLDAGGNTRVYASYYDPTEVNSPLTPITEQSEWNAINRILEEASKVAAQNAEQK